MTQKRKSSAKKKSGTLRSSNTRKRKSSKKSSKLRLNGKKTAFLTAAILSLCAVFLALNIAFNYEPKSENFTSSGEIVENTAKSSANSAKSESAAKSSATSAKSSANQKNQDLLKTQEDKKIASLQNPQNKSLPQKFQIPQSSGNAKIAFVIDDAGLNTANLKRYTDLPFNITIAVLPQLSHSKDCAYIVRSSGQELILHQPMQSVNLNINPGEGAITPEMSTFQIAQTLKENLSEIGPNVKGMNNHEGSLISADVIKIGTVLDVAFEEGIYFLDSRTNVQTKAPQAALERDMKIYARDVFIDNVINRDAMLKEIMRGIGIANKNGHVIMIGHVDKSVNILPDLLSELYPYLREKGYVLSFVSELPAG